MAQFVREVMSSNPVVLENSASVMDAARKMRDGNIGDVIVRENGKICGIVTDRDIVVRALAAGKCTEATVGDVCSRQLVTISPNDTIDQAITLMREKAVRRLPVVDGQKPVGMVSLGDLARDRDRKSVLGKISEAPPNR